MSIRWHDWMVVFTKYSTWQSSGPKLISARFIAQFKVQFGVCAWYFILIRVLGKWTTLWTENRKRMRLYNSDLYSNYCGKAIRWWAQRYHYTEGPVKVYAMSRSKDLSRSMPWLMPCRRSVVVFTNPCHSCFSWIALRLHYDVRNAYILPW